MRFAKRVFFPAHERIEQSELRVARGILRTIGGCFLQHQPSCCEIDLRARVVLSHEVDAPLQIAFRERDAGLRGDRFQPPSGERLFRASRIAVHLTHTPALTTKDSTAYNPRGETLQRG